ncbi:MAG: SDR family oxidoreductase, partial [Opitutales bacterium]
MKIVVIGATGLLGSAVCRTVLRRKYDLMSFSRTGAENLSEVGTVPSLDLTDDQALTRRLLDLWPDAIINCAAVSSPDTVDADPASAKQVNVDAPVRLGQIATHLGSRYIHISTDLVFDGTASPYRSTDQTAPVNEYGRQKLEAEKQVLQACEDNVVVLRVTLVNGNSPSGKRSQHEKLLWALADGQTPTLFEDEFRQPSSADNVGDVLVELCERPQLHGLFHWAGSERISRYELGVRIFERFGLSPDLLGKGKRADLADKVGERPGDLAFVLEPLAGKIKTRPLDVGEQLEELCIPGDLYDWYR